MINAVGKQGGGQGKIGPERGTGQNTNDDKRHDITRAQRESPDEGDHRDNHAGAPGTRRANAPGDPMPDRHRNSTAQKINQQEKPGPCFRREPVANIKQHKDGGDGTGKIADEIDAIEPPRPSVAQQIPKTAGGGGHTGGGGQTGGFCRRAGMTRIPAQKQQPADDQQYGKHQRHDLKGRRRIVAVAQHARQNRRGQNADKAKRFAGAGDARAIRG